MTKGTAVAAQPVTDGKRIRWTLEQVQQQTGERVRLDWLRFTLPLDAVVQAEHEANQDLKALAQMDTHGRRLMLMCRTADASIDYTGAMSVARAGAELLVTLLGVFEVGHVEDKGMDFYTAKCAILFEGAVVGMCLAGGKTPDQAGTVHFNLFGSACLHLSPAKWRDVRSLVEAAAGWLTRVDLAVDVWAGDCMADLETQYLGGAFDVRGQRPSQTNHGSWTNGHSRTFNVGKRETGKMLRAYEKGHELFGAESADPWIRYEVEIRNNARVLDLDVLTRPADFFAGAYPFCEALLDRLNVDAQAQRIPAGQRVADATVEAAVTKSAKWVKRVAAPTICALLTMGGDILDFIVNTEAHRVPGRLRGFTQSAINEAFEKVAAGFAPPVVPSLNGA